LTLFSALFLPVTVGQFVPKAKKEKQPRALGLIEISLKGKPRLIPIAILIDGEFYDASAYKAAPVPMALYSDTVYEGVKSGVSQGLFTVKGALHGNDTWIAEGSWRSAEEIQTAAAKRKAPATSKASAQESDGRPVLRRSGQEKPASVDPPASDSKTGDSKPGDSKSDSQSSAASSPASAPAPATPPGRAPASPPSPPSSSTSSPTPPAASSSEAPASSSSPAEPEPEDKNRPSLRRGKPTSKPDDGKDQVGTPPVAAAKPSPPRAAVSGTPMHSTSVPAGTQVFPAISDADGPEPRPYAYAMKPEEEQKFLKGMLGLAASEVQARAKQLASATASPVAAAPPTRPGGRASKAAKPPEFDFTDVQLHGFDLSNSNEPVLVLTANARLKPSSKQNAAADFEYLLTLVARQDIYADLHKVFANVTDTQHLDVLPRVELVDAVDADGDGRGELLFRQVSDAGNAYALYRVIGNQLWPLFQGTPQ
jgi:hypothetical protein